jgi:uncharacterized protein YndB with AHSA1/START domain
MWTREAFGTAMRAEVYVEASGRERADGDRRIGRKDGVMSHSMSVETVIRAPRERVWQALTDPAIVKKYFFGTNLETDWKIGSPLFFRGEYQGQTYEDRGTVLTFEPMRTLSYDYWSSFSKQEDKPELRQIVRFDLDENARGIRITVHQSNVDTKERAEHSKQNWQGVLEAMKKLLESEDATAGRSV